VNAVRLPAAVRNPVSLAGIIVATGTALLFVVLLAVELLGWLTNPYIGLLAFVAVPIVFVLGLLLIPAGIWWARRRRPSGPELEWPVIDLGDPQRRAVLAGVLALTAVNVVIVSVAAYGGVHYMESSEFCGQVCHTTMEPQYVAASQWPHARISCVACHVGPGAGAAVESKLAGTRQLLKLMTDGVPKPIPSATDASRPGRDTCASCHRLNVRAGDSLRQIREYGNDEANSESVTTLRLHVGGSNGAGDPGTGIHWHMSPGRTIEYIASDATRQTIPYVRLTEPDGRVREFVAEDAPAPRTGGEALRRMDCIDCHSRPAHTFYASPERAVDADLALGRLPKELPFLRREAVSAIREEHTSRAAALDAIARRLNDFYAESRRANPESPASNSGMVARAIVTTQEAWSHNVFPEMKVTWGTYSNQLGHVDAPGCFRCHDDRHKAGDGTVIRQDCELCHTIE
jgi:hypothetical protein